MPRPLPSTTAALTLSCNGSRGTRCRALCERLLRYGWRACRTTATRAASAAAAFGLVGRVETSRSIAPTDGAKKTARLMGALRPAGLFGCQMRVLWANYAGSESSSFRMRLKKNEQSFTKHPETCNLDLAKLTPPPRSEKGPLTGCPPLAVSRAASGLPKMARGGGLGLGRARSPRGGPPRPPLAH